MIERMGRISNPLTIIAIFAALAEIAGTISLGIVDASLQSVFVWFVMLFPVLLVASFFLTLNFNPKVLYAPADFRDDKSFIATVSGDFDRPFLTVQRGDVGPLPKTLPPSREIDEGRADAGLKSANASFALLLKRLKRDMAKNKLWSIGFGMEGEGYFILRLVLPREIVGDRRSSETSYIIKTEADHEQVRLHAIGTDITETDPQQFSARLYNRISKMLDSCIDPARLAVYKPPEKGDQSDPSNEG